MLFPYTYVPHQLEKVQGFINYIFYEVWCKAATTEYDINLFAAEPDLYRIMNDFFTRDLAEKLKEGSAAKFFYEGVNEIYNEFKLLSPEEIEEYQHSFKANNDLLESCCGNVDIVPMVYRALNPSKNRLNDKLNNFFKNLYSSGFLGLSIVRQQTGVTLSDYAHSFVQVNDRDVCPFCGLLPIDGQFDLTREAFDHYLPKSKYPFNSVNLRNLAPSCNKCNSGNKGNKDPLHNSVGNRRKAFYPFTLDSPDTEITISINDKDWDALTPEKITIEFHSEKYPEEVETWKELFCVDQRYAARCCSRNGGKAWLNRILNEHKNYGLTPSEMFGAEIKTAQTDPWGQANFLKKSFLEGCNKEGLFLSSSEEV